MQFEALEARQLLATITTQDIPHGPATGSTAPYYQTVGEYLTDERIDTAFQRAANLAQYTSEQLAATDRWVLQLQPTTNVPQLAQQLGTSALVPQALIHDTYIYNLPSSVSRLEVGKQLQHTPGIVYAYPLVKVQQQPRFIPNDPLFPLQWHLQNTGQTGGLPGADANVTAAWDTATGNGVVIGIVDDGLQHTHPDLASQYVAALSTDICDGDNDPAPDPAGDFHGTSAAGVAAAATNNGVGVSGAAPNAKLAGIRLIACAADDTMEAAALSFQSQQMDIYSNSWGPPDQLGVLSSPGPLMSAALAQTAGQGRGGLGSIITWAGGNGRNGFYSEDNSNYDGYANLPYVFAVAAIDHVGKQAYYSESGANLLISAPSSEGSGGPQIVTTDLAGAFGYNDSPGAAGDDDPLPDLDYTSTFGGTSSATPLVSGVIALMLDANPNLTLRDVEQILINTAVKTDPTDADWYVNGAGYAVNHKYGFGRINAAAAVAVAAAWTNLPAEVQSTSGSLPVGMAIPDNNPTGISFPIDIPTNMLIETVDLRVDIQHNFPADLEVVLISPSGTRSVMSEARPVAPYPTESLQGWFFSSKRYWGEDSQGQWRVEVRDRVAQDAGTFNEVRLNFTGIDPANAPQNGILRGTVWNDTDSDGVQDPGETGAAGVTVFLDANSNGLFDPSEATAASLADGSYTFNHLGAGTYHVDIVPPVGGTQTFPAGGANQTVTLTGNQVVSNINFGVKLPPVGTAPFYLSNIPGDGTVRVGVDGFGAFGSFAGALADEATFDPVGPIGPAGTTFQSAVALGLGGTRVMLATGVGSSSLTNPLVTGSTTSGSSSFINQGLQFQLQQTLEALFDSQGQRVGSRLVQTYTITNPTTATQSFDLVRYLDGDLDFDGSLIDGGGRLTIGPNEILFETDTAAGTADSTTFVGITANGGLSLTTNRYEVDEYRGLLERIEYGQPLDDTITGDGPDDDQFVDVGQGYDVTLALRNAFILAPGEMTTYVTSTIFGSGAPEEIAAPPPPPPPPTYIGGGVINDLDADGMYDANEPGIANAIVFLDLNNDGQLGLGEPAQTTNAQGQYRFLVRPGTYTVRQAALPGWTPTQPLSLAYEVTVEEGDVLDILLFGNYASTDYGDAPAPYPTLAASGGASHGILADFHLGYEIDGEGDGKPSVRATGDDNSVLDDDDGVYFLTPLRPGQTASVIVGVDNGSRAAGLLHAWIDFNGDGDWADAGEQIFANQHVVTGINTLTFQVPAGAVVGNTYARFRYGYGANLSYTGHAIAGEVEDYFVSISGPKPLAKADAFTVYVNSSNNSLDVLLNDVAGLLGPNTISGYNAVGSLGGKIQLNAATQTLSYTPPANTTGTETFSYNITDSHGGFSSAQVSVLIDPSSFPPVAVDDTFRVGSGSAANILPILDNDQRGSSLITSISVSGGQPGAFVRVDPTNSFVRYTPPTGFVGFDQFQYTARDANGRSSNAIVSVHVGADAADDAVQFDVQVTDVNGELLSEVPVGAKFQVRIFANDLRAMPPDPGVRAAFLDLLYTSALVTPEPGAGAFNFAVQFGSAFNSYRSGVANTPGLLNEIGARRGALLTEVGPDFLMAITFTATATGTANFVSDPAELGTLHDVLLGNSTLKTPLDKITFGAASIDIVSASTPRFFNAANPKDVNHDGQVTPLDAVMVVNELNSRGPHSMASRLRTQNAADYLDVDGDNALTPLDAMLIVNWLNSGRRGEGEPTSAAEPTPSASSPSALSAALATLPLLTSEAADQLPPRLDLAPFSEPSRDDSPVSQWPSPNTLPPVGALESFGGDGGGSSEADELDDLLAAIAGDVNDAWQSCAAAR